MCVFIFVLRRHCAYFNYGCYTGCDIFYVKINRVLSPPDPRTTWRDEKLACKSKMCTILVLYVAMTVVLAVASVPMLVIAIGLRYLNVNHPPWRRACSTRKVLYKVPDARSSDSSYLSFMGM